MDSNTVVTKFNKIYRDTKVLEKTRWMGIPINKYPTDLWIYQEIISTIKPDLIIETKTHFGANALYLASLLDVIGNGHIISIDKKDQRNFSKHHRITYLKNDPLDTDLLRHLSEIVSNHRVVMVILNDSIDSEVVLEELVNYYNFVSIGSYMVVENTCVDIDYQELNHSNGPMQAIDVFLYNNIQFIIDNTKDKFLLTANPNGYLVRMV